MGPISRYPEGDTVNEHNEEFLRLLRVSRWHQARAARELGLNTSTVSRYRSGETTPSIQVLRLFAGLIAEPLVIGGVSSQQLSDGPRWLEDWESELIHQVRRIPPENRKRVVNAFREILDSTSPTTTYRGRPPKTESDRIAESTVSALTSKPAGLDPSAAPLSGGSLPPVSGVDQDKTSSHRRNRRAADRGRP